MASNICDEIEECSQGAGNEEFHHRGAVHERLIPENRLSIQQPETKTILTYIIPFQSRDADGVCFSMFLFVCFMCNFPFAVLAFRSAYLALRSYRHNDEVGELKHEWWTHVWIYLALIFIPCYIYITLFALLVS
ncbi:uncharacterized protein LOC133205395 [Saccostrea echinata]|uniref:uncharacterized protein LOC133205395 n=1 Tax=Saccostrea echinata TaxID=191078 RepID=UPI002A7FBCE6|nr:uncharacterized protein LOC133205395 [Saccostrea echinata]